MLLAAVAGALLMPSLPPSANAGGSARTGQQVYDKHCLVCHAVQPEFHKEGPSLAGVYGRRAGRAPFFTGYKALKGAAFVWDEQTLDAWLADPRGLVGGKDTGMTFRLEDPQARADVIAYLKGL
jgi:cytochrome c